MNGISSISKTRWAITAIVLVHLLLVPLAINAITIMLGVQKGLTFQNQIALGSIVTAQYILLTVYMGFGSAQLYVRTVFFLLGCTYVVLSVVWAQWMLGVYPSTSTIMWLTFISMNTFAGALPAFGSAVVVSALRPLVGRGEQHENDSDGQFQVSDLLKLMMLVAALLCCL